MTYNKGLQQESVYFSNEELKKIGAYLLRKGEFIKAKNTFKSILKELPNDVETLDKLSQTLWNIDNNTEEASKHHHQALSIKLNEYIADNPERELQDLMTNHNIIAHEVDTIETLKEDKLGPLKSPLLEGILLKCNIAECLVIMD